MAASTPAERRRRPSWPSERSESGVARMEELGFVVPAATEELDVYDAPDGLITALDAQDGTIRLTRDSWSRTSHMLGLSLGLAVAVRLDALERRIDARLKEELEVAEAPDGVITALDPQEGLIRLTRDRWA